MSGGAKRPPAMAPEVFVIPLRRWGHSYGVLLRLDLLARAGADRDAVFEARVEDGAITLRPMPRLAQLLEGMRDSNLHDGEEVL